LGGLFDIFLFLKNKKKMEDILKNHDKPYFLDIHRPIQTKVGSKQVDAMILPHAATPYVHEILSLAFDYCPIYDRIILFTTNHSTPYNYEFRSRDPFFSREHSYLSILPFLQKYSKRYDIYAIGNSDTFQLQPPSSSSREQRILWIANTDLLHCYENRTCKRTMSNHDQTTIRLFQKQQLPAFKKDRSMCGYHAVRALFRHIRPLHVHCIQHVYSRSDVIESKSSSAVGYVGMLYSSSSVLSKDFYRPFTKYAWEALRHTQSSKVPFVFSEMKEVRGIFVTLMKDGHLFGCMGTFSILRNNLIYTIAHQSLQSAFHDPRFPSDRPLPPSLVVKINYLHELEKCNSVQDITIGVHGIYVTFEPSQRSATYLASVLIDHFDMTENNKHVRFPSVIESLAKKAQLYDGSWSSYTLFRYQCIEIE